MTLHAPARRHRHRRRQPVGRRGAREPAVREHLRAAAAARAVRAARRAADLRHHASGRDAIARSAEVLRALLAGGDCEIGAHHHAWETPPCTRRGRPAAPVRVRRCRCAQFEEQLASLTDGDRRAPSASGRCRTDPAGSASRPPTSPALERLGYLVESSVAPLFYEAHKGGPGLRRGAADARTSSRTTARRGRARAACWRCRCRRR